MVLKKHVNKGRGKGQGRAGRGGRGREREEGGSLPCRKRIARRSTMAREVTARMLPIKANTKILSENSAK